MELSIAVNNYKNPELLRLCLDSIKKNVHGTEYELIVADGATEEATEMMMREDFPEVKFFPFRKNVGLQALIHKALEASTGKYILLLNGDIIVTENSVEGLLDYIRNNPGVGMVGPKLQNFNGTLQNSCFRFYRPITIFYRRTILGRFRFAQKHLAWFSMDEYDHRTPKEVDWLMGSALLITREAMKKVGYTDRRFFMYMEDVDWCRRFWEAGYKVVYYPLVSMFHYHGKGSGKAGFLRSITSNRLTWIHISSALKYFIKYWGKPVPKHN
jgi:GT2 family glycosyltransferase